MSRCQTVAAWSALRRTLAPTTDSELALFDQARQLFDAYSYVPSQEEVAAVIAALSLGHDGHDTASHIANIAAGYERQPG